MSQTSDTNTIPHPFDTTDFGIFYPVGYLVAAFSKQEDAQRAQQALIAKGFDQAGCTLHASEDVAAFVN